MRIATIQLRETTLDADDFFMEPSRRWWWELEIVDEDLRYTITDDLFYAVRDIALRTCAQVAHALKIAEVKHDLVQISNHEVRLLFGPVTRRPCSPLPLSELSFGLRPLRHRVAASIDQVAAQGNMDLSQVKRCESKPTIENLNLRTVRKYLAGCGFELQLVPVD